MRGGSLVVCPVLAIATRGKMSNACSGQLEPVHSAGYTVFPRFLPAGTINFRACQDAGTIRGRVQFEGGNKTRAGSISLGSACSLECLRASALLRYDVLVAANNEISAAASAATLPGFAVH